LHLTPTTIRTAFSAQKRDLNESLAVSRAARSTPPESGDESRVDWALWSVPDAAKFLKKSISWVRRNRDELQGFYVGRSLRFKPALILGWVQATIEHGKSLKPERKSMPSRYQRGSVQLVGTKIKVWYGMFRVDVLSNSRRTRRQRKVRLGTILELPSQEDALTKLHEHLVAATELQMEHLTNSALSEPTNNKTQSDDTITFQALSDRWVAAEGPSMKPSTLSHYRNALNGYVLPTFGTQVISSITREQIQLFLVQQARRYSRSTLRSIRVVFGLTLGWAFDEHLLPRHPCTRLKLPRICAGKRVKRSDFTPKQVLDIVLRLEEPYATLVLFISATGLRVGEAAAIRWSDFSDNVLHVSRRIYNGEIDAVKSESSDRTLPISTDLMARLKQHGGRDWVFQSRRGTPINPGNALKRYVKPAAEQAGFRLGGWHDFRHTLTKQLRRAGVHPKVTSSILGHSRVTVAMDVYDHPSLEDFRAPLEDIAAALLPSVTKSESTGQKHE
jgi:integrase